MNLNESDQTVFVGSAGSDAFLCDRLKAVGASRILCVTGRESFRHSGAEDWLFRALGRRINDRFFDFSTNHTEDDVRRGVEYMRKINPDCILAVGGGSVLDMAKLIKYSAMQSEVLERDFPGNSLPIIAIPTTGGSGSEATRFAVMYNGTKKVSVEHDLMKPNTVLLNADFMQSQTAYQKACCGFDALAQGIESCWAVQSTSASRKYSRKAVELCVEHLELAVTTGHAEHLEGMLIAAHFSGKAIDLAKTTAAHALSYGLTRRYGLPHGHAVAMMLPWVFECNVSVSEAEVNDPRGVQHVRFSIRELSRMLGCSAAKEVPDWLQALKQRIGLGSLQEMLNRPNLVALRETVVDDVNEQRLQNNPRKLSRDMIKTIADHIE